jgi:hypothetical protein
MVGWEGFEPPVFSLWHLVYSQAASPFAYQPKNPRQDLNLRLLGSKPSALPLSHEGLNGQSSFPAFSRQQRRLSQTPGLALKSWLVEQCPLALPVALYIRPKHCLTGQYPQGDLNSCYQLERLASCPLDDGGWLAWQGLNLQSSVSKTDGFTIPLHANESGPSGICARVPGSTGQYSCLLNYEAKGGGGWIRTNDLQLMGLAS